jgi:hypothetical protein
VLFAIWFGRSHTRKTNHQLPYTPEIGICAMSGSTWYDHKTWVSHDETKKIQKSALLCLPFLDLQQGTGYVDERHQHLNKNKNPSISTTPYLPRWCRCWIIGKIDLFLPCCHLTSRRTVVRVRTSLVSTTSAMLRHLQIVCKSRIPLKKGEQSQETDNKPC